MEASNEIRGEDKHEKVYDCKSQMCQAEVNPLATEEKNENFDNVPQLHDLMDIEDPRRVIENQSGDSVAEYTVPVRDTEFSEKGPKTFTEKGVAECELPKLIVCFREASYQVKDICIDEGVPSLEKFVIEDSEVNHNGILSFSKSGLDANSDLINGAVDSSASISEAMKPMVEHGTKLNLTSECPSENLMEESKGDFNSRDGIVNVSSTEKFVPEDKLLVRDLETGKSQPETSNCDDNEGPQQSDQDTSKEAELSNFKVHCTAEDSKCNDVNGVGVSGTTESRSLNIDPSPPPPVKSVISEDPQNSDCHQLGQTLETLNQEDGSSESLSASSRSFFSQRGQGESSFSDVDVPSALVTCSGSGPIPYSGNISLRSDSSTTSNRSFAFPVLQSDWNSSPVRMAKADGRHYPKHQRWKLSLLCCRF